MTAPDFRLSDRTALVTGAASGIGRRIAFGLAEMGADVGCVDLAGPGLETIRSEIEALGRSSLAVAADVTVPDDLAEAVRAIEADLGPLRLAVNCAGIANAAPAEEMSRGQFTRVLEVNTTGVFLSCQAEARAMLTHGGGSIVNIASMSASIVNRVCRRCTTTRPRPPSSS